MCSGNQENHLEQDSIKLPSVLVFTRTSVSIVACFISQTSQDLQFSCYMYSSDGFNMHQQYKINRLGCLVQRLLHNRYQGT